MNKTKKKALVVTTAHRGVFFGYSDQPLDAKSIRLEQCRMCIYWSAETKGVLGLAATGPTSGCKITPSVPAMTVQDVTGIMEASAEAVIAWETGMWQ